MPGTIASERIISQHIIARLRGFIREVFPCLIAHGVCGGRGGRWNLSFPAEIKACLSKEHPPVSALATLLEASRKPFRHKCSSPNPASKVPVCSGIEKPSITSQLDSAKGLCHHAWFIRCNGPSIPPTESHTSSAPRVAFVNNHCFWRGVGGWVKEVTGSFPL